MDEKKTMGETFGNYFWILQFVVCNETIKSGANFTKLLFFKFVSF